MNKSIGYEIGQAIAEMKSHIDGKLILESRIPKVPESLDVKRIRAKFGYSQNKFASHFGFTASSIREWEQGRRKPERYARILLAIIDTDPKVLEKVLKTYSQS